MRLLVVTGLLKEAAIASGDGVVTICSGGRRDLLAQRLDALQSPPRAIVSFGLAGGLAPHLQPGDLVIASHVLAGENRYDADEGWSGRIAAALDGAMKVHRGGAIAGSDIVLTNSTDKTALHAATGALAVDMESHVAADYARRHALPFAALRAVSDPASRDLPPLAGAALRPDGSIDLKTITAGALRDPSQIPALIAAGSDSGKAFAALRRGRGLLGPLLGLGAADL